MRGLLTAWGTAARGTRLRWALAAALALLLALDLAFPPPLPHPDQGLVVTARDGTPLRTYPGRDGIWRQPVAVDAVSPLYLQALLTYEDRWFRWHPGVNPAALLRAGWQALRHGRVVSGGSTLTMQVARILDPPAGGSRSLAAKLRQVARAVQLEMRLSKDEILAIYLHRAPMGGIVEGVEMASRSYLGRDSRHLSHAEAAMLAVLPQAPSRLRPDRAPDAAQAARDKVLARMLAAGVWSAQDVADARMEQVAVQPLRAQWIAPLAAERLRSGDATRHRPPASDAGGAGEGADLLARLRTGVSSLARRLGAWAGSSAVPGSTPAGIRTVRSTLDIELQSSIERMLRDRIDRLPPKVSMAVLVMHNDSLEVRAYAGSADFSDASRAAHVDMVRGVRSPGSTLKPFLYALALDDGLVHSESLLVDAPQSFSGYQPGNFQASFSGPVSVAEALQRSLNVPAVDLLDRIGPARFAAVLRAGGLRLRMPAAAEPNLSLILGGAGTTLEELVGAYRALARGGLSGQPRLTADAPRVEARLMSPGSAFIVRDILEAGGHPDRPFYEGGRRIAWKTGTSFGFRDAWAIGVTDEHTIGVWVGRPDGTPNPGFFGANIAAPLLHDIVAALPASAAAPRPRPASVSSAQICWPLGLRADATAAEHCAQRRTAWLLDGAAPPTLPERERSEGLLISAAACGGPAHAAATAVLAPGPTERAADQAPAPRSPAPPSPAASRPVHLSRPWANSASAIARWPLALQPWVGEAANPCGAAAAGGRLQIEGLADGAVLKPVPGQRGVVIQVRALGAATGRPVYWLIDGVQQARAGAGASVTLQLAQTGAHAITALDEQGRFQRIRIRVAALP
ncbi:MAG: penicillin-binding protein 1C [Pseudomonadota bacterium]